MSLDQDFSELDDLEMELSTLSAKNESVPLKEMDVQYVDPRVLRPNPWNPNSVDPVNQTKLENSIRQEGIKRPIVVRELPGGQLQIIGGQHRTLAAIELGHEMVPVINRGVISDSDAKKETLLDNYRYGTDNLDRLSELLADPDIGDALSILETMPIDEEELANYFSHMSAVNTSTLDEEIEAALDDGSKPEDDEAVDLGTKTSLKTHQIIRFRVSVEDQAKLAELIKQTKIDEGLIESDDLTNDGDALIHLLRGLL